MLILKWCGHQATLGDTVFLPQYLYGGRWSHAPSGQRHDRSLSSWMVTP